MNTQKSPTRKGEAPDKGKQQARILGNSECFWIRWSSN